jgi:hypothetical protein
MTLTHLPLLQVQLDLYALPRGMERFRAYIRTMTDEETGDLALPLVAMNPMGKDHVPELIRSYLALDAEGVAAGAIAEAAPRVAGPGPAYQVGLVVSDDLKGGWTNRYASEFAHRIEGVALTKRGFLTSLLWTSEPASQAAVRDAVLTSIHRAHFLQSHRAPATLGEMLAQEGYAMARAGCSHPALDSDDLAYTRTVVEPHLTARDRATVIACLFGDEAARALGYPPQGLSNRAGFALALHDARLSAVRSPLPQEPKLIADSR